MVNKKLYGSLTGIVIVAFVLSLSGCAGEKVEQPLPKPVKIERAGREVEKPSGTPMISIRQKDSTISISKSPAGPVYTVTSSDGGVVLDNATKEEFKAKFPQEYNDMVEPAGSMDKKEEHPSIPKPDNP